MKAKFATIVITIILLMLIDLNDKRMNQGDGMPALAFG